MISFFSCFNFFGNKKGERKLFSFMAHFVNRCPSRFKQGSAFRPEKLGPTGSFQCSLFTYESIKKDGYQKIDTILFPIVYILVLLIHTNNKPRHPSSPFADKINSTDQQWYCKPRGSSCCLWVQGKLRRR